ncbi:MAG: endo alpha-1,4 polygalactosaminidase, partial [Myxococcales bacterium]|nr:endo alpha-1,4 polygalactosaminidase [Myxococcales bacterium]
CGGGGCEDGEVREGTTCVPYVAGDPEPFAGPGIPAGVSWQWQITGTVDTSLDVDVYDVDLFELTDAVRDAIHARGSTLVCYFSAGSYEPWTPDAAEFPEDTIGRRLEGWPDERWLDVNDPTVREILEARLDLAVEKGCDGVEPDNVTAWDTSSGFGVTQLEQLAFNRFLADAAHVRGLSVALKNDVEQIADLLDWFDYTVNEECWDYDECDTLAPFVAADKAVLHTEYVDDFADAQALADRVCPAGAGFSTIIKEWDLGPERLACP